ncbi:hypothetical protein EPI10_006182 [Gossypium australe]|uniref:Uncharacterized protein n=1 Tax=Gossypium australe TaxID=47621 RepID=A0A5B6WRJ0_9ROSI|nr:hypothetical protein EPI10_006182 [Gossypium australe]
MGLKGINLSSVEAWLKSTNRVLQQLECTLRKCVTHIYGGRQLHAMYQRIRLVGKFFILNIKRNTLANYIWKTETMSS